MGKTQTNDGTNLHLRVRADLVAFADRFKATEATRYYLHGVYVEPSPRGGVILVATDGHIMTVLHDPEGFVNRPATVAFQSSFIKSLSQERKARKSSNERLAVHVDSVEGMPWLNTCEIHPSPDEPADRVIRHVAEIDGSFPAWRRAVPSPIGEDEKKAETVPFLNTELVAKVASALKLVDAPLNSISRNLRYSWKGPADPIVVNCRAIAPGFVIVMPMRDDEPVESAANWSGLPDFAKADNEAAA